MIDIAHSELTNCYYVMKDGQKIADVTEQIINIKAEVIDKFVELVIEYGMSNGYVDAESFIDLAEQLKENNKE